MRRTTSGLVVAALLALLASPSLHAHSTNSTGKIATTLRAGVSGAVALCGDPDCGAIPHDADLCPICRATAQARFALRAPARAVSLAVPVATLPLPLAAPAAFVQAPVLSSGTPRSPPSCLALEA